MLFTSRRLVTSSAASWWSTAPQHCWPGMKRALLTSRHLAFVSRCLLVGAYILLVQARMPRCWWLQSLGAFQADAAACSSGDDGGPFWLRRWNRRARSAGTPFSGGTFGCSATSSGRGAVSAAPTGISWSKRASKRDFRGNSAPQAPSLTNCRPLLPADCPQAFTAEECQQLGHNAVSGLISNDL